MAAATVHDTSLFRDTFGTQEIRECFSERSYVSKLIEAECALAQAEEDQGVIPSGTAKVIRENSDVSKIDWSSLAKRAEVVGYPILGLVEQMASWVPHQQDILASQLQIKNGIAIVERHLDQTISTLESMSSKYRDTPMTGRTHLQHALPITFGYKCGVWLSGLRRHAERLQQIKERCLLVQFGGAAGTLASLGSSDDGIRVRKRLAAILGLKDPVITWHVARDTIAEVVNFFALIGGSLGKIALDLMIMSSNELNEVAEPFVPHRGASSTMPQKRNPISSEIILAQSKILRAQAGLVLDAMVSDFERASGPWHLEWAALPVAFISVVGSLYQANFALSGLQVNSGAMKTNLESTRGLIVAEAGMMKLAEFIGRQEAHEVVYVPIIPRNANPLIQNSFLKCDGQRPVCLPCVRGGRSAECVYDTEPAETRNQALKRKHDAADEDNSNYHKLINLLRSSSADDANDIVQRLRRGARVDELVQHVETGNLLLELCFKPQTQFRHSSGNFLNVPDLLRTANNPYATSLVCTIKFDSPSSTTPVLPTSEARALYDAPYSTARMVSSILDDCRPSQWTTVSSNDDLLREILRCYFTSVYVFLPFFHKDYFLHDLKRGSQRFCSPLLVNSVLAAGCRACSRLPDRHQFWNPSLLQYKFLAEARRLRELCADQSSITRIQADMVLHLEHGMNGQDKIGWSLCIAAVASAHEMGLFDNLPPGISHAQKTVRTMTAWALFAWQALQSYHQEKPPLITLPPTEELPSATNAFGEIWVKYSAADRPVPLHFSQTFVALAEFRSTLNDIANILYPLQSSKRRMTIVEASSFHLRLQEWYRRLPDHLNPYNLIFPAHFHLHMHYWLVTKALFEPIEDNTCESTLDTSEIKPKEIVAHARTCLQTLIRLYYTSHGDEAYELFTVLLAQYISFSALNSRNTPLSDTDGSFREINNADVLICAYILRGQARMAYLSDAVLLILEKHAPAELNSRMSSLIGRSEEADRLAMVPPVQIEWPIYIGTMDRDKRRLRNLFKAITETSLDNEEDDESLIDEVE
ncbi:3-carboxy-cis,cis-muconate cycloisomerase [Fusarium denticulatum]|uniref:3-carboxy-cis,cis-muconate cycloisomerase n=1 Tax=Fusarium denticulatum TaxID=48507 RepID=A0A8H5XKS2_9HYPO|nr:3-carboxy-cis,cis-muconate cycloisomerase [Fusarium denticulatum]